MKRYSRIIHQKWQGCVRKENYTLSIDKTHVASLRLNLYPVFYRILRAVIFNAAVHL